MNEAIRVAMISLGCARNLVDSEVLLGHVVEEGLQVVKEPTDADVVVVNTCGFIETAKQESIDTILSVARLKEEGNLKGVIAVGCLAQRYGDDLKKNVEELDAVFGLSDYSGVPAVVRKIVNGSTRRWVAPVDGGKPKGPRSDTKRFLLTPKSFAYLRISEGCDHTCTFCAIPKMRGKNRSKPIDVLVEEAQNLAAAGVQELVVVAEDSTAYGLDTTRKRQIHVLLEKLGEVDGIRWIRLMYAYPHTVLPELTTFLREHPKAVKYLDIPIQHISSPMLKAMKRGVSGEQVRGILDRLRSEVPGIAVRSTLIAGFPGETEADFQAAKELVSSYRFERLGVFPYSQEEDTPAYDMPDQVPGKVAEARVAELMELQRSVMRSFHESLVGTTLPVLVDGYDAEAKRVVARTWADAPEVDGRVLLPKGSAEPGQMLDVTITKAHDYELEGALVAADGKGGGKKPAGGKAKKQA
ncbi:MAG: 30S ribosomal protein S12 methylthiotransferase RimO [Planctomycetes bacterium]|nr:30S ribosomal protein S12 methylthiotransferase RimO [Planctomycetota bacterium]